MLQHVYVRLAIGVIISDVCGCVRSDVDACFDTLFDFIAFLRRDAIYIVVLKLSFESNHSNITEMKEITILDMITYLVHFLYVWGQWSMAIAHHTECVPIRLPVRALNLIYLMTAMMCQSFH